MGFQSIGQGEKCDFRGPGTRKTSLTKTKTVWESPVLLGSETKLSDLPLRGLTTADVKPISRTGVFFIASEEVGLNHGHLTT